MNYNIKLGKPIWIRYIGYFLIFVGLASFLIFIILWLSGNKLPTEMSFVYYTFIVGDTILSTGIISIILIITGKKIAEFRIYSNAKLNFDENGGLKIESKTKEIQLKNGKLEKSK